MKLIIAVLIVCVVPVGVFAADDVKLGSVVAVKRTFKPDVNACLANVQMTDGWARCHVDTAAEPGHYVQAQKGLPISYKFDPIEGVTFTDPNPRPRPIQVLIEPSVRGYSVHITDNTTYLRITRAAAEKYFRMALEKAAQAGGISVVFYTVEP